MKLTKSQLKKIIKEELSNLSEGNMEEAVLMARGIRDAIVGHIESERLFEPGAIPQPVLSVVENAALRVVRAIEGEGREAAPTQSKGIGDESYEDTLAAYKKNPEFFN